MLSCKAISLISFSAIKVMLAPLCFFYGASEAPSGFSRMGSHQLCDSSVPDQIWNLIVFEKGWRYLGWQTLRTIDFVSPAGSFCARMPASRWRMQCRFNTRREAPCNDVAEESNRRHSVNYDILFEILSLQIHIKCLSHLTCSDAERHFILMWRGLSNGDAFVDSEIDLHSM